MVCLGGTKIFAKVLEKTTIVMREINHHACETQDRSELLHMLDRLVPESGRRIQVQSIMFFKTHLGLHIEQRKLLPER